MVPKLHRHQRGAALVTTIIVLCVLTVLVVGFLTTMLTERRAATAFEDSQEAKLISQGAVAHAIDLLRSNIPEPARLSEGPRTAKGTNWIVNPGRLTIVDPNGSRETIPLHTGEYTGPSQIGSSRDAESADLNQPLPGQKTGVITGSLLGSNGKANPPMRVRWVNVLRDPSHEAGEGNPLIGRYAFWMDDESARLNLNTAVGKPKIKLGEGYGDQVTKGFLTPLFPKGDSTISSTGTAREWALGRPQSVNLDVLFGAPDQLDANALLAHTFLHGFSHYPEAILDYVRVPRPRDWYESRKFHLTAYSRSPEFNVFGLSRFFTTYVPLSLEGGPAYQHPFLYDPTGAYDGKSGNEVLHLNSLLGTFGFTSATTDEDGASVNGGNVVNRAQVEMLTDYLRRRWPGYDRSFFEKYGEAECRQIALNAALFARMATTLVGTENLTNFSRQYSMRTTSVNYSPASDERQGRAPERMYWRFTVNGKEKLMLPQTPGPHITEVRLFVRSVPADPAPKGDPKKLKAYTQPRYIQYWYETEYYMHNFGPVVDLAEFPTRMDFLDLEARTATTTQRQQFGVVSPEEDRPSKDWNHARSLGLLKIQPVSPLVLGPAGATWKDVPVVNRRVVRSEVATVGQREAIVPNIDGADYSDWDPFIFDAAKTDSVEVKFRFRPGMGVFNAPGRPRQMIPLGETADDTLKATFKVSLVQINQEQAVSWQISDPRLSANLAEWEASRKGPGDPAVIGTPGRQNENEPSDTSFEKSKYRYLLWAPKGARIAGYDYHRGDEYDTRSRVSSPGYWSLLHTGMQTGKAWRTLDFSAAASQQSPPDWLLLDLLGATYPMANDQWKLEGRQPDEYSTVSYMNSTAGQINLNSRIYPRNDYFCPPERSKPLEAVFSNLPGINAAALAKEAAEYQTDDRAFAYVGELANLRAATPGATQWDREFALRNMAGCLTTRSNTFGVWGVAQVVQKLNRNMDYGRFERGDEVRAEKRFYAVVERYIWPGRDGVPGNAHTNGVGKWDRLARQSAPISVSPGRPDTDTLFQLPGSPPLFRAAAGQSRLNLDTTGTYAEFDGPERVGMNSFTQAALGSIAYRASKLEDAYNPPQPVTKYRIIAFRYLDQ